MHSKTDQAVEVAKEFLVNQYNGYGTPLLPTDEDGNPEHFEVGCVEWLVCTGIEVKEARCIGYEDEAYTIELDIEWGWSDDEEDDDPMATFHVWVEEDGAGELSASGEYERVD